MARVRPAALRGLGEQVPANSAEDDRKLKREDEDLQVFAWAVVKACFGPFFGILVLFHQEMIAGDERDEINRGSIDLGIKHCFV